MIYINILVIWNRREQEIECIYSTMKRISISNCVELKDEEIMNFNKKFLSSSKFSENIDLEKVLDDKNVGNHKRRGRVSFIDEFLENK
jgi:hypothetical protein